MKQPAKPTTADPQFGNRVKLYPDGKYRWVYEVPMLRNPAILIDVFKVLGISFGIVWLFVLILITIAGDLSFDSFWSLTSVFLLLMLFFLFLGTISYIIFAWINGWKYIVLFTLNEHEVIHQQMPRQVKKAQVIGELTSLLGALAGRPGMVGTGLLVSSHTSSISNLANVRRVIPRRRIHLIKVNQLLNKNRVFVCDEDFDFVYNFLCEHCTQAKKG